MSEQVAIKLISDLISICGRVDSEVLGKDRVAIREIGQELSSLGGWDLMQTAYLIVRQAVPERVADVEGGMTNPDETEFHASMLAPVWDRIGEWVW